MTRGIDQRAGRGDASSVIFGVALLASGLSSSTVGTLAGQVIMEGFLGWKIPTWLRRGLTMLPALIFIALNANPDQTLVISQVVLSFVLPFAIVPLLIFTSRRSIMGGLVNRRATKIAGWVIATIILGLNVLLIGQTFGIGLLG
jgi:manganese transport protein